MSVISCKELRGIKIPVAVVEEFEVWFQSTFGLKNVRSQDVLAHYINLPNPDAAVIKHLLDTQFLPSVVWGAAMGRTELLESAKVLFVPRNTVVNCDVRIAGLVCSGDVEFKKSLYVNHHDIRVNGQLTVKGELVSQAGCLAYAINIPNGSLNSHGDLIVERGINVGHHLVALNHLKALYVNAGYSVSLGSSIEVERGITSGRAFAN